MTNGFGPTIENAKKQQAYIDSLKQQFGEMTPVDQSLREKSVNIATDVMIGRLLKVYLAIIMQTKSQTASVF